VWKFLTAALRTHFVHDREISVPIERILISPGWQVVEVEEMFIDVRTCLRCSGQQIASPGIRERHKWPIWARSLTGLGTKQTAKPIWPSMSELAA
jgi:hypothetical protein